MTKIVTLELYGPQLENGYVVRRPKSAEDAVEWLQSVMPDEPFVDAYIDINDDERVFWQRSCSLVGCQSLSELVEFVRECLPNIK